MTFMILMLLRLHLRMESSTARTGTPSSSLLIMLTLFKQHGSQLLIMLSNRFSMVSHYIFITILFIELAKQRQTKNLSDNHVYRTLTIFIVQYLNLQTSMTLAFNSFAATLNDEYEQDVNNIIVGPFSEFNMRWYLVCGTPILIAIGIQIFFPHIGVILSATKLFFMRCWDRKCSCDKRATRQITQDEYEDLYTGPEYILQLRFA
jgi:hypothetical protein